MATFRNVAVVGAVSVAASFGLIERPSLAQPFNFEQLVDLNDVTAAMPSPAPDTMWLAKLDGDDYIISGERIADSAAILRGNIHSDTLELVFDSSQTPMPDTGNPSVLFTGVQLQSGLVSFIAASPNDNGPPNTIGGLYGQTAPGQPITPILTNANSTLWTSHYRYASAGDAFAFTNSAGSQPGSLYTVPATGGTPTLAVALGSQIPDGETGDLFTQISLSTGSFDGSTIAFVGEDDSSFDAGVYTVTPGSAPQTVVDTQTVAPNETTKTFDFFGDVAVDGDDVAFYATVFGEDTHSLFARMDGNLIEIADTNTPVPGRPTASFTNLGTSFLITESNMDLEDGRVLFMADTTEGGGMFLFDGTQITSILQVGDGLLGHEVTGILSYGGSLSDNRIIFNASTDDGTIAAYTALIPEPTTGMCVLLGLAALSAGRGRRSR